MRGVAYMRSNADVKENVGYLYARGGRGRGA